jgi:hypothetical protein
MTGTPLQVHKRVRRTHNKRNEEEEPMAGTSTGEVKAKTVAAMKKRYARLLRDGGVEAVYRELCRTSLIFLLDESTLESQLLAAVVPKISAERRREIQAEVQAALDEEFDLERTIMTTVTEESGVA